MAATKKKKKTAPVEAPEKKLYVEPIVEISAHNDPSKLDIPGWVFRWQNLLHRNKSGWTFWRPVRRESELGAEVAEQFGISNDKYVGQNENTDFFMFGPDGVLAYTSQELFDHNEAQKDVKADAALRAVGEDIKITRHVQIDPGPYKNTEE